MLYGSKLSRGVCLCHCYILYLWLCKWSCTDHPDGHSFCGPNELNHFYGADSLLLVLACSDTYVNETAMFVVAGSNLMFALTIILISYIVIFTAILQGRSPEGRCKSVSTCGSHLTVVTMFYGTLFWMYLRLPSEASVEQTKNSAVFYVFVSPMLNPLIYSLQNKDVKRAIRKVFQEKLFVKSGTHLVRGM